MAERPATKGGGAGDQGADPQPISRGMGREAGREEQPVVEEPREGPTGGWLRWERPAGEDADGPLCRRGYLPQALPVVVKMFPPPSPSLW